MALGDGPLERSWIVAVHESVHDFSPLGAGLVIDDNRVLTCTHVLPGEGADLWVAFPNAQPLERRRVYRRVVAETSVADVAVLYLEEPVPDNVRPPRLRCPKPESLRGERWWGFGFAESDPLGNSADGEVGESLGYGWVRLDSGSRYVVERGFSGGGLWSPRYEAVVGLVGQANERGDGRALTFDWLDHHLPSEKIRRLTEWSAGDAGDVALAAWGWRLERDPETRRHWGPRSRGVAVDSERGFRFRGRRQAITEIVAWLDRPRLDRRVLVVTGSPGVGKSAVLGRLVTTADSGFRRLLPIDDDAERASEGSVGCAVHAKGKTALEVAAEIAKAVSAEVPLQLEDVAPFLRGALEEGGGWRFNVVVDALDEAQTPAEARLIIEKVVRPLVETCVDVGVQVVVGSRRHDGAGDLLAVFGGAASMIDLDRPKYFALEDLTAYALASVQLVGDEREDSPYADNAVARPVARRIAELADRNFLVAGLVARDHGMHDIEAIRPEDLTFTTSVESALVRYVERVPQRGPVSAELALAALAFAEAPGFTPRLWAIVIEELSGVALADEEMVVFARSSAANFLVEHGEGPDGPVFRLFHQALNDALLVRRRAFRSISADETAITRTLLGHGRSIGWGAAPAYLLRSLPTHAARAGLVDELLADDGYLLHADLLRLLPMAHRTRSQLAGRRTRLLMLTPEAVRVGASRRAALLSVTNALDDLDAGLRPVPDQPYRGRWAASRRRTEVATLEGHAKWVRSVCSLDAEGRILLASGSDDRTLRLWDPTSGEAIATLEGHAGGIQSVCSLRVAGRILLASGSDDRTVRLWDPTSGEAVATLEGHTDCVRSVCSLQVAGRTLLASGSSDRTVLLWDPASGDAVASLEGHADWVWSVCSLQIGDRTLIASGSDDRTVRLWDPTSRAAVAILEGHTDWVRSVCSIQAGGRTLLASGSSDHTVRLWDPARGDAVTTFEGHASGVLSVCSLETRDRILLASGSGDGTVRLWDPDRVGAVATLYGHTGGVLSACSLESGGRTLLASGSSDCTVRLWAPTDVGAGTIPDRHTGGVRSVCSLDAEGRTLLASGSDDRTVRLWDPTSGEAVARLEGHTSGIRSVCSLRVAGRTLLASGSDDRTVRLWDPTSGEAVVILEGHTAEVRSVCSLQTEARTLLASGSSDCTVRLWDPASGKAVASLEGHTSSVLSVCSFRARDQTLLASSSSDCTVRLWDPTSGKAVVILEGHTDWVRSVCFLQTGARTLLVSGSSDGTVRLWDPGGGETVAIFKGHHGNVLSVCSLQTGARILLASGGDDRTVRLWDPVDGRTERIVPVRYEVWSVASFVETLAIGLTAGVLVLDIPGRSR